jgi:hypothetical protein
MADEITPDQLRELKSRITQGTFGENQQSSDWAGYVFADVLGMDGKDADDRRKIGHEMNALVKLGDFVVVERPSRKDFLSRTQFRNLMVKKLP